MKRPRQYASEIVKMGTREQRKEALLLVPEKYRVWVKDYVDIYFEFKRYKK